MSYRLSAILLALVLPVVAQTTFITPAKPGTPEAQTTPTLDVARSGNEVMITWTLPALEIKQFEIMRNTTSDARGRGRVAALRTEPAIYLDKVPDETVTYWYWAKMTLASGQVINVGPVATPESKIWTP